MFADAKSVAAINSEYRLNSHADMIVGRILEGYDFIGKNKPQLQLISLYTDQVPKNDWSRALAKKHSVSIYDTVEKALTRGADKLAVAGVLCISDSGRYPTNTRGQHLYPRRRFFEQVAATFEKLGQVVPVFSDLSLGPTWEDARWLYDRARELMIPLMAGSVLPLTWRQPPLKIPMGCYLAEAIAVGYGEMEPDGFHALEMLQCMVERRKGGESGVARVQCLEGADVWRQSRWSPNLLNAALQLSPDTEPGSAQQNCRDSAVAFLIDYSDGLNAAVLFLNGHVNNFTFAAQLARSTDVACQFYLEKQRPFSHFTHLVQAIERMILTGHPPYPVERTLLSTGVLDALMTSRSMDHSPIDTPELVIRYEPWDYPSATAPIPGT